MSQGIALVKRLASMQERQSRRAFADAIGELRQAEAQLNALDKERESVRLKLAGEADRGTDVADLRDAYRYLEALAQRIDLAAGQCVEKREAAARAEDDWIATRRNLKGLETIVKRREEKAQRALERRHQNLVDDLYANRPQAFMDV